MSFANANTLVAKVHNICRETCPSCHPLWGQFPAETTAICRDALLDPASQVGYFSHFSESNRHQNVAFAIDVLKVFGNNTDCSVLRRYASDRNHGKSAIVALRAIEERLVKEPGKEA